jgi:EmrB/QacA subfamily drug resistance transporter
MLIAQVDTSVANLATNPIGADFHSGVGALQWVVDAYNLTYAVLLLTGGLLADLYGRRRVFMAGAAVFTLASVICAMAPSIDILIAARAGAGVGAALMLPASLAIIRVAWPDPKARGRALGIWTGCNGLAFIIGPTLGGFLIHAFGWRSVFFIVVPLSALALVLALPMIPESADPKGRRFDAAAQILGILALGGFALAAIESHDAVWIALAALFASIAAFVAFVRVEKLRGDAVLVPLDLFRLPVFRGVVIATAGMTFGMYGVLFLQPLAWQTTGGFSPIAAGLGLLPMALVFVATSPFSGWVRARLGTRFSTAGGVAIIGLGMLTVSLTTPLHSIVLTEIGLALTGLGMGFATGPLVDVAVGSVSTARSGTAAALINVARMVGATVGVAIIGAIYALAGGGETGLTIALFIGGMAQIAAAAFGWQAIGVNDGARKRHA